MQINIDESGNFAVPQNGSVGFCCVGGLVIPDAQKDSLEAQFAKLAKRLVPAGGEIKGRLLPPPAISDVLDLLNQVDAKLFVTATAGSFHTTDALAGFRDRQADILSANLTPAHTPTLRAQMAGLQVRMRQMSPQEFLQFNLLARLVEQIIRITPNHFGFCAPAELGAFHWTIDAKSDGRSALETCWAMIGPVLLQGAFLRKPAQMIPSIDLSAYDATYLCEDQSWPAHIPAEKRSRRPGQMMDLGKLMRDSFRFADSATTAGLQLADIATNAFRRAVRGDLPSVHRALGQMLLGFDGPTIGLVFLDPDETGADPRLPQNHESVLMELEKLSWRIGQTAWVNRYFRRNPTRR